MNTLTCPRCTSVAIVKNGHAHTGKQRFRCRACGFQFTFDHARPRISDETAALVDRLLTERLSHRGICRAVGVRRSWLRLHLQKLHKTVPHGIEDAVVTSKKV